MGKRNNIKAGCGIFLVCVLFVLFIIIVRIYHDFSELSDAFQPIEHSTGIEFSDIGQTVFITTRQWGLLGNHSQIVISDVDYENNGIVINKEKDIIFDEQCGLYYKKQEPDSLLICMSSLSYSEEEDIDRKIGNVNVKINRLKDQVYKKKVDNLKSMGWSLISCSDRIE
jgi:hypothetical protein